MFGTMRRKIYDALLQWKREENGSVAIMVDGARRVGKSSEERRPYETVREFFPMAGGRYGCQRVLCSFRAISWSETERR